MAQAFRYVENELYCEKVPIEAIEKALNQNDSNDVEKLPATPFYVYSKQQLTRNIQSYQNAVEESGMRGKIRIFYAVKANANLRLLEIVRQQGCGAVTVSGYEIKAALAAGFRPEEILLNGNGKQTWEIDFALNQGCLLNVDSIFDAENIVNSARKLRKTARVLIRINPELEGYSGASSPAHHYLATALKDSKFGVPIPQLDEVTKLLKSEEFVQLVGLHCHLGSTIRDASLYANIAVILINIRAKLVDERHPVNYLDIGGGLGIDYDRGTNPNAAPLSSTTDLIRSVSSALPPDVELIIEPGRSIVANTGILVTKVLGTKDNGGGNGKHFVVVDAAMNDLIRPSFYQAYHHILPIKDDKDKDEALLYDIVGPICESGDFLAQKRLLHKRPIKGDLLAVCDVGAYGIAMASNYNMRTRGAEVLVDENDWKIIRRRETFNDLVQTM